MKQFILLFISLSFLFSEHPEHPSEHPSTKKKFWIAPIAREDLVEKIIQEADLIFVSPMCWDEMRKRAPASKQLKTYENFISQETVNHLRELQLLG